MKRYEALAAEISESIASGVLAAGDRLPSVRQACASRGVSPSTVFQAYYLLEAQRLIEARERSGYYVAAQIRPRPPELERPSAPAGDTIALDVSEQVFEILQSSMVRDVVPLGSAFPSPLLFPLERLGAFLASTAKTLDPWSAVDDLTPGNEALRRQIALRYLADGLHVRADELPSNASGWRRWRCPRTRAKAWSWTRWNAPSPAIAPRPAGS